MIFIDGKKLNFSRFPDGTSYLHLGKNEWADNSHINFNNMREIVWAGNSDQAIIELILFDNALYNKIGYEYDPISFVVSYLPYARQDKIKLGEPLSVDFMVNILSSLNVLSAKVFDPHTKTAIYDSDRVEVIPSPFIKTVLKEGFVIFPDNGAYNRYLLLDTLTSVTFTKERVGGKVKSTYLEPFARQTIDRVINEGHSLCVWDDIIDGGATFIEVAQYLKTMGIGRDKLKLFATHSITPTKTNQILLKYYKEINYTNSRFHDETLPYNHIFKVTHD